MFKNIVGIAILTCSLSQAFAFEVECNNEDEAMRAKTHGFTCSSNNEEALLKATRMRQQRLCAVELKKLGCQAMQPAEDSGCMIGKAEIQSGMYKGEWETKYVAFFNKRLKLTTVVQAKDCKIEQVYFAGQLTKFELFDNKLFALVNGKPMLFDENAKLYEFLSQSLNSYNMNGAMISDIRSSIKGDELIMSRDLSKYTNTQKIIKIKSSDITINRLKEVKSSEFVHAHVKELGIMANVYR